MDREWAERFLEITSAPVVQVQGGGSFTFSRQSMTDVEELEKKTTEELVGQWKALYSSNHVLGSVSVNEMTRMTLIEAELDSRKYDFEELNDWSEQEHNKHEENSNEEDEE
jgi:hypothetical protein